MKTVENFILGLDGQQMTIVSFLHQHLVNHYNLIPKINWNIPFYYRKSSICYLNPIKNEGIELVFLRGKDLSNEQGILQKKGRKLVTGIDLFNVNSLPERIISEIINEAIILDDILMRK